MKYLFAFILALLLLGAGCAKQQDDTYLGATYENAQYGFAFDYPTEYQVKERAETQREYTYVGQKVDFFASFRDLSRSQEPDNIFYLYAIPDMSVDAFVAALEATNGAVKVTGKETKKINGIELTTLTSTTEAQEDKHHYLFERNGQTIILSEFLREQERSLPVLETLRPLTK